MRLLRRSRTRKVYSARSGKSVKNTLMQNWDFPEILILVRLISAFFGNDLWRRTKLNLKNFDRLNRNFLWGQFIVWVTPSPGTVPGTPGHSILVSLSLCLDFPSLWMLFSCGLRFYLKYWHLPGTKLACVKGATLQYTKHVELKLLDIYALYLSLMQIQP